MFSCTCTTVFGTWLGAIPIPLDSDRPWQVIFQSFFAGKLTHCLGVAHFLCVRGLVWVCCRSGCYSSMELLQTPPERKRGIKF